MLDESNIFHTNPQTHLRKPKHTHTHPFTLTSTTIHTHMHTNIDTSLSLWLSRSYYSFMFHNHHHDDVDAGSGSCHRTKQETEKSWKNEWGCLRPSLTFSCIFFRLPNEWFSNHQPFLQPLRADEVSERLHPLYLAILAQVMTCVFSFEHSLVTFWRGPPKVTSRLEILYGGPFVSFSNRSRSRAVLVLSSDTEKQSLVWWVGFGKCCFFQYLLIVVAYVYSIAPVWNSD